MDNEGQANHLLLDAKEQAERIQYRLYSPLGAYPSRSVSSILGSFIVQDDFIASVVSHKVYAGEIKLNAALLLSVNINKGFIKLYPLPYQHQRESHTVDAETIRNDIKHKIKIGYRALGETIPEFDLYQNAKGASLPLILRGTVYNTFEQVIDTELLEALSQRLVENYDKFLLALLESLLLSNQASCHFQFQKVANNQLLDSLILLEKWLAEDSVDNISLREYLKQFKDKKNGDALLVKSQLAESMSPIEYNRLFTNLCHIIKKYLLTKPRKTEP